MKELTALVPCRGGRAGVVFAGLVLRVWGPGCSGGRRVDSVVVFRLEQSSGPGY